MTETTRLFDGTKQGLFDTVANHLFTQGRPALMEVEDGPRMKKGSCMYRSPMGLKCAVGCLIPDERYDPVIENKFAADDRVIDAVGADSSMIDLMLALQDVHDAATDRNEDGSFDRSSLDHRLRNVASDFKLSTAALPAV